MSVSFDLPQAWRNLQSFLHAVTERFAKPRQLLLLEITRRGRAELRACIESAECALRKVLLLEALALAPSKRDEAARLKAAGIVLIDLPRYSIVPYPPEVLSMAEIQRRQRAQMRQEMRKEKRALGAAHIKRAPKDPWRVTFRLAFSRAPLRPPPRGSHHVSRVRRDPMLRLAQRLCAIANVFDDPAFHVRRMAAAIARDTPLALRIAGGRARNPRLPRAYTNDLAARSYEAAAARFSDTS